MRTWCRGKGEEDQRWAKRGLEDLRAAYGHGDLAREPGMKVGHSSFSQGLPQARHCVGAGAQCESTQPAFDLQELPVLWEWHK